ncbi:MAG TPA: protein kinase [Candidatus Nanoarchaeia archaeon]|nr:protein kinase [Candidatus Nanoarchaeia archaeon]
MVSHIIQPGAIYRVLKSDDDGSQLLDYWARELDSLTLKLPEHNGTSDKAQEKRYVGNFELGNTLARQGGTSVTCLVRAICNDPFGRNNDSAKPRYVKDGIYVMKSVSHSQNALLAFVNEMMIFSLLGDASEHNIATLVDCNDNPEKGPLYMVFDKIPYESQRDDEWLRKIDPERVVEIASGIAKALVYLHKRGIVHGDIKPDNVRIDQFRQPLILDLGSAFVHAPQDNLQEAGLEGILQNERIRVHGSVYYAPPEYHGYLLGDLEKNPKDFKYDVHSFGIMLYELLTGDRPFSELVESNMAWQDIAVSHRDGASPFRQELLDTSHYGSNEDARFLLSVIKRATAQYEQRPSMQELHMELLEHFGRTDRKKSTRVQRKPQSERMTAIEKARQELAALEAKENGGLDIHAPVCAKAKKSATTDNDTISDLDLKLGGMKNGS